MDKNIVIALFLYQSGIKKGRLSKMGNTEEAAKINLDAYGIDIIDQIYGAIKNIHYVPKEDYYWGLIGSNQKKYKDGIDKDKKRKVIIPLY